MGLIKDKQFRTLISDRHEDDYGPEEKVLLCQDSRILGYNFQEDLKATVGIKNGLKLILDLHSDNETFGTVPFDWSGFQVRSKYK